MSELKRVTAKGIEFSWSLSPRDRVPGMIAFAAGLLGAVVSYQRFPSVWLSIFVFAMVVYAISRFADVLTRPRKLQRALDAALLPAGASGIVYVAYALSNRMWLAVLLGFLGAAIVQAGLGGLLLPQMRGEEALERRPAALVLAPALIVLALAALLSVLIVAAIVVGVFVLVAAGLFALGCSRTVSEGARAWRGRAGRRT